MLKESRAKDRECICTNAHPRYVRAYALVRPSHHLESLKCHFLSADLSMRAILKNWPLDSHTAVP